MSDKNSTQTRGAAPQDSTLSWSDHAKTFHRDGALLVPNLVPASLIRRMNDDLEALLAEDWPHVYRETNGPAVRAVYGLHERGGVWQELLKLPALVEAAQHILGEPYYVFQWKINPKAPNGGQKWEWHRDYVYWDVLDGMPEAKAINISIFMTDVTEATGPTRVVRGSHRFPLSARERELAPRAAPDQQSDGALASYAAAEIPYYVPDDEAEQLGSEHGFIEATGDRGSAFFFHSNVIHGSLPNLSPDPRIVTFLTLNPISNAPQRASVRAGHMVNEASTAIPTQI